MEIKPDFCKFETCKILKQKGIDINCDYGYFVSINPDLPVSQACRKSSAYTPNVKESFSAPELHQVVKYLRLKHYIHIKYEPTIKDQYESFASRLGYTYVGTFNSPEIAIEAAIQYAIENLIDL